jgi:hypothetical protein
MVHAKEISDRRIRGPASHHGLRDQGGKHVEDTAIDLLNWLNGQSILDKVP